MKNIREKRSCNCDSCRGCTQRIFTNILFFVLHFISSYFFLSFATKCLRPQQLRCERSCLKIEVIKRLGCNLHFRIALDVFAILSTSPLRKERVRVRSRKYFFLHMVSLRNKACFALQRFSSGTSVKRSVSTVSMSPHLSTYIPQAWWLHKRRSTGEIYVLNRLENYFMLSTLHSLWQCSS